MNSEGVPLEPTAKNLVGRRFGMLRVVAHLGDGNGSHRLWLCECDCGRRRKVRSGKLVEGIVEDCGCETQRGGHNRLPPGQASFNAVIGIYRLSAGYRNLDWSLTADQCRALFEANCYYCGSPPKQVKRANQISTPYVYNGIDRVDSNLGYFPENVVTCCGVCNRAKGAMSMQEFLVWARRLGHYQLKKWYG